ncbi:MAG: type II secretion system F family protein [Candidatus Hydrogenedentes bacterium]|nr:type II secretion system F family protein [Candidatus Hydrogenedentota bacterium]
MPQFRYEVKKGPGDLSSGVLEAESQRAAVARLRDMGYFPIKVEEYTGGDEKKASLRQALIRVKLQDRNIFFRQLANLIESGMPITRAVRTMAAQTENPKMKEIIEDLRDQVQKGASFAEAMEQHPTTFSAIQCSLVRAGETGGMLEEVLWRLVAFGEQEEELRGKAISAMVYPIFLLILGTSAVFILVSFVFPKFVGIFKEFNVELPLPTQIVMLVCDFMSHWWWAVLIFIGLFIYTSVTYFRTENGKRQWDSKIIRFPVAGKVVQKYEMAKFARTLGTLLDNGVPVLQALRITADTMSSTVVRDEVSTILDGVMDGEAMSESMARTVYFPPLVISMFAVGEESGRIGAVTQRLADAYDLEVDRAVKAMTALFEPIMIVVMGAIIGFLVIAMLLPMLTLSTSLTG